MTNQRAKEVRLVKCPKCNGIHQEMAGIPVYQCGGCGAFLRAKRLNNITKEGPQKHEANTIPKNELELSNEKEAQSLSQTVISTEIIIHPTEVENHGIEESSFGPGPEKAVDHQHTADNEKLLANMNPTDEVAPINQTKESNEFPSVASNQIRKQLKDVKCEVGQSTKFAQRENEELSLPTENYDESLVSDVSCSDENDDLSPTNGNIVNEGEENCVPSEDLILKPREDANCTFEVSPSIKLHEHVSEKLSQLTGYEEFGRECARDANISVIISSEEQSPKYGTNTAPDQHSSLSDSSLSVFRLSTDTNLESPYILSNQQPETIARHNLYSISSVETEGNAKVSLLDVPAAPYFSYEGSASSYDEIDDHAPLNTHRRLRQMRNCKSHEKDRLMEGKKFQQFIPEYRRCSHPVRIHNPYRKTGHYSEPCAHDFRFLNNGRTSTCRCNNLKMHKQRFDVVKRIQYAEDKKTELLQMINELQDQLNDIQVPTLNVKGKYPDGTPYYDPILTAETYHQDANYSRQKVHSRDYHISRMAFSVEEPYRRYQADPQSWHYSSELPPCQIHSRGGQMGHNYRISSRSAPQMFSGYNSSPMIPDRKYDCICHLNNNVMKKLTKKRLHSGQKHVRPTVGGAPFVVCYHCKKLLQLPSDFLVFKNKKSHQLRCGSCSHLLRFSFENDNCMQPKIEKNDKTGVVAPPPSEVNTQSWGRSYAESNGIRIRETRKISTGGTSSLGLDEEIAILPVLKRSSNVNYKGMPSSNVGKAKPTPSSTLHQLMGYSSPSQIFVRGKGIALKQTPSS